MPESLAPGRVLGGRYRIEREIARGGMGTVWQAADPLLARQVAVKTLDASLGTDEQLRARFRREAIAAAAVAHPNIVATYDTGEDEGVAYIVMELVDGVTLRQLLDANGALPVPKAADIAAQVADALSVAHARGLVHRDVKPGNVLVQPDGRVKVTDFGIAKATGNASELTREGMVVGTARYLAPEQVDGRVVDQRSDVYSLGLVLYEMLSGKPPFEADTDLATAVARLTAVPQPLARCRSDVSPGLQHVVDRALERDPAQRWPSAAALRDAIEPFRSTELPGRADTTMPVRVPTQPAPPAPEPAAAPPPGTGSLARVVVWVLAFALGATAGYVAYRAIDDEGTAAKAAPTVQNPVALPIVAVRDYDPEGDGSENPDDVGAVTDGNATTFWTTETYYQADVGGLKEGVGLVLDLGDRPEVERVELDTPDTGSWSAQVYLADTVPKSPDGWGNPAGGLGGASPAVLDVAPPRDARYVLVWVTELPRHDSGYQFRVAEMRVLGTP